MEAVYARTLKDLEPIYQSCLSREHNEFEQQFTIAQLKNYYKFRYKNLPMLFFCVDNDFYGAMGVFAQQCADVDPAVEKKNK